MLGPRHSALALDEDDQAPLDSMLSIRATVLRVGVATPNAAPAVRFSSGLEDGPFTLQVSDTQLRQLSTRLLTEVDIEARVSRNADGAIERGKLERFDVVEGGDPRPAWREWFRAVNADTEIPKVEPSR
jgi:hypothetical protein